MKPSINTASMQGKLNEGKARLAAEKAKLKAGFAPDQDAMEKVETMFRMATKLALYSTSMGMTAVLIAGLVFFTRPEPQNYAIYPDGTLVALTPVSDEIPQTMISAMVSSAILTGLRFDFQHHLTQIERIKDFMSPEGYDAFAEAIQGVVNQAIEGRYVVSTDIIQPTIIGKSMVKNGTRIYRTSTIVLISMEGQNARIPPFKWVIESIVRRVPQTENPRGFIIDTFIIKPYSGKV